MVDEKNCQFEEICAAIQYKLNLQNIILKNDEKY
jgi:hypothetical protein